MIKLFIKSFVKIIFKRTLSKIKLIDGIHDGGKVYIIADSKEIAYMEIDCFDDAPAIFFNYSIFLKGVEKRKHKTYFHILEGFPYFYLQLFQTKPDLLSLVKKRIKELNLTFFTHISNVLLFSRRSIYVVDHLNDAFSEHFFKLGYPVTGWSILFACSLAKKLGFDEIILVGFSQHDKSFQNHWYNYNLTEFSNEAIKLRNHKYRDLFFKKLSQTVKITSISAFKVEDSYLKTMTFEDLTGIKASLKNPTELTDNYELLHVLNSQSLN